ncbi:TPA: helix-turn-helix domain-containing protein, partial [Enterococcus faecalis]|nr:helix-turn-helix domain-containing protein [Enterococcus faecalis]HBC4147527.1 helix-turn-helix domain-containing protein [Enterococcus faecalis]
VTKQVAPNPTAAIFWLKNRKPDEWRDRKETEVSGSLNISDAAVEIEQFFEDDST